MALFNCEECGNKISDKAAHCVHCGAPVVTDEALKAIKESLDERATNTIPDTDPQKQLKIQEGIITQIKSDGASKCEILVETANGELLSTGLRTFKSLKYYSWSVGDFVSFENDDGVIKDLMKSTVSGSVETQTRKISNQEPRKIQSPTLSLEDQNLNNALFAGLVALIALGVYLFSINNGSTYAEARIYSEFYNIRHNGVSCYNLGIFSFCNIMIFEPDGSLGRGASIVIGESVHSGRFIVQIAVVIVVAYIGVIYTISKRLFLNSEQKSRFAAFEEKVDNITDNLAWIIFWAVMGFGILSIIYLSAQ